MEIKRTILDLFPNNHWVRLTVGIEAAIAKSFETNKMNTMTQREVKDRFDRCIKWAEILRGDMGWGTERINQALPYMLQTELSGSTWTPSERLCWVQSDG